MENQNTALTHIHESLGAKMVSFAGYNMPVQYQGCLLYTSPSPRDLSTDRMPSSS